MKLKVAEERKRLEVDEEMLALSDALPKAAESAAESGSSNSLEAPRGSSMGSGDSGSEIWAFEGEDGKVAWLTTTTADFGASVKG